MGIKKNSASESEKQYNPGKKQKIRQWFVGNRNSLRARVTINVLNPTKKQTLPITSRENADQSRIPSKATNAQQNAAPDTHVQNAILSTGITKIKKDTEEAIL